MIKQVGNEWCVFTKDGSRKLGCHPTKAKAQAQLMVIDMFKRDTDDDGEIRDSFVEGLDVRTNEDGTVKSLTGYAAVFNQETIINGPGGVRWREQIAPTAFQDVIGRDDVIAAVNHDSTKILGRTKSRTLTLSTDDHGLRYDVKLGNTSIAKDVVESVRRGDLQGSSFRFLADHEGIRMVTPPGRSREDLPLLIVEKVKRLVDVGPATFPAYPGTSLTMRSVPDLVTGYYDELAGQVRLADAKAKLAEAKAWQPSA